MSQTDRSQHPTRSQILSRAEHHDVIARGEITRAARQKVLSDLTRGAIEAHRHTTTPAQIEIFVGKTEVVELFGSRNAAVMLANEVNRRMAVIERDYHAPRHFDAQIRVGLSLDAPALELA